jgi:CheY-like chemotaxis protein
MECFKVLVVHRQEVMLEEVKSILEKSEPYVRRYQCGIDGLQAAKLEAFDLILCGTDLPLITGFEMVRSIRNLSRNGFTPVIFISDFLIEGHQSLSRRLNALGIIGRRNLRANVNFVLDNSSTMSDFNSRETNKLSALN